MVYTKNNPDQRRVREDRRILRRAVGRRLTLVGVLGIALGTVLIFAVLSALAPIRAAWNWVEDIGQQVGQWILPDDQMMVEAEQVFAVNFEDDSLLGEATADIVAENLSAVREGDLFGWGESSQSINQVVATVRWQVQWEGAGLTNDLGRLTVHLAPAQFAGVWVLAEQLPMPQYDANWMARLGDVFNGVDDPQALRDYLAEALNKEAADHSQILKDRAEAAAARTITELLREQDIEADVVFDG